MVMGDAGHCACGWGVVCAMLICKAVKKNFSKKTAAVIGAAAFAGAVLAVIVIARTPMPL